MAENWKGGERLKAYLKGMSDKLESATSVRVGFLEGSTEADGTSIPMVAAIQEFGAPKAGIPPGPFFRTTIAAKSPEWGDAAGKLLKSNGYNADLTLNIMGEAIAGQLRQSIIDTNSPPLSQITLMLRQMKHQNPNLRVTRKVVAEAAARVAAGRSMAGVSTKPLIWSGDMLKSIDYEVSE